MSLKTVETNKSVKEFSINNYEYESKLLQYKKENKKYVGKKAKEILSDDYYSVFEGTKNRQ